MVINKTLAQFLFITRHT